MTKKKRKPFFYPARLRRLEKGATLIFLAVLASIGGVVWAFYEVNNWYWRGFILVIAGVEAWALANPVPSDTLSDRIWTFCRIPLVTYFLGLAFGYALAKELLPFPVAIALSFISAHFVWQKQSVYDTLAIEAFAIKYGKEAAGAVVRKPKEGVK